MSYLMMTDSWTHDCVDNAFTPALFRDAKIVPAAEKLALIV